MHANLWIAVLISTSALLGGCGDKDARPEQQSQETTLTHEQYQQAIIKIVNGDDMRSANRLYFDTVATEYGSAQCTEKVRAFYNSIDSIVRQVEALHPPQDAIEGQREFLDAAEESVRLVGVAADDVGKGALKCGRPLNSRIYGMPSTARAESAISRLEQSGYFIGGE
jgi:hypothetical protein